MFHVRFDNQSVFDFKIFDVFISVCKTHLDAECVPGWMRTDLRPVEFLLVTVTVCVCVLWPFCFCSSVCHSIWFSDWSAWRGCQSACPGAPPLSQAAQVVLMSLLTVRGCRCTRMSQGVLVLFWRTLWCSHLDHRTATAAVSVGKDQGGVGRWVSLGLFGQQFKDLGIFGVHPI